MRHRRLWKFLSAHINKGDLVGIAFLAFSVALALLYYAEARAHFRSQAQAQFEAESVRAHGQLLRGLDARSQTLRSLVAFFEASADVGPEQFEVFAESLLEGQPSVQLCWMESEGTLRLFYPKEAAASELCRHFDALEPSKIIDGAPVHLLVSEFAQTQRSGQRGFASVIFELRELLTHDPLARLDEYLVINDSARNTLATYRLHREQLIQAQTLNLSGGEDAQYFELSSLGSVSLLHVASPKADLEAPEQNTQLLLLALLALCLMTSLYLRGLVIKRESIALEVARKTDELSQFAYRTSHDLRAPLVTVGGLCQAIVEDLDEGETGQLKSNLARIEQHVQRLDRLVADILELSRADLSEQANEPVLLDQICEEVIQHVNTTFSNNAVETRSNVNTTKALRLPRARIFQILENLLSNSIKYADLEKTEAPYARIEVAEEGRHLTLTVRDNGLGIPSEYHGRLFGMFERFHPGSSQVGSGLGMSIVKRHVDRLNGEITVDSDQGGTTVTIRLPKPKENEA